MVDDWIFKRLKQTGQKYSPDQPREPAGSSTGGQWTSGGGWKPAMTNAEADAWAAGTALAGETFYHYGSKGKEDAVLKGGFQIHGKGARGTGIYLTDSGDPSTTNISAERKMTVRVRVEKPFEGGVGHRQAMEDLYRKYDPDMNLEESEVILKAGFDALILYRTDGSRWLILSDPKQATVVGTEAVWR